jgi:VanZ family protein
MAEIRVAPTVQGFWLTVGATLVALIVWGSLTPSPPNFDITLPDFDKVEHFSAYLMLTAWFTAAFPRRWLWVALVFAVLGGLIEILQGYTGRDPEWGDWLADCLGVAAGVWYPARWALRIRLWLAQRYAYVRT